MSRRKGLSGVAKGPTIVDATGPDGINRKTANRMVDPKGYFNKSKSFYEADFRSYLALVEKERR